MKRRRYQSPDGLDWRDPQMPVLRQTRAGLRLIEPERVTKVCAHMMDTINLPRPADDPTYNLRRRK